MPRCWPRRTGLTGRRRTAAVALTAAATWAVLGGTSLVREARAIGDALAAGDVEAARERLPHLCGRDPQALDAQQIARAVVESVAENTSDAVVGALVWGAVAGVPGLVGFRAVNTLDAMVGPQVAPLPPVRLGGRPAGRRRGLARRPADRRPGRRSPGPTRGARARLARATAAPPEPQRGPVEAAFAGALGVRLGGTLGVRRAGRAPARC